MPVRPARVRAPFSLRCGAILIDYALLAFIVALSTVIARMFGGGARRAGTSMEAIGFVVAVVAAVLNLGILPAVRGRTIGKWVTGLSIELVNGEHIGFARAFLRHFLGYPLSLLTLGLGFLVATVNVRGRALHDMLVGTVVVSEGRR